MIIPASILEPFGFIGIPQFDTTWARITNIDAAVHRFASSTSNERLSPAMMSIVLRSLAIKNGAHSVRAAVIHRYTYTTMFKVTFTLEPDGVEYFIYPKYIPK